MKGKQRCAFTACAKIHVSYEQLSISCVFQSAVALCVGVGSFSDPDDIPGFAHFLEHSRYHYSRNLL